MHEYNKMTLCDVTSINKKLLTAMVGSSVIILIGVVEMDHLLDKGNTSTSKLGLSLFVLGWVLVSVLVSVNSNTGKFDWNLFLKRGLPALVVMAGAIVSQKMLAKRNIPGGMIGGLLLYASTWALFSSMLIFTVKERRKDRLAFIYGGGALVVLSMIALSVNRKYNALTGRWDGPENVYGLGLPMYTLGWVSISVGVSLC